MKVRHIYLGGRRIKPNNGDATSFWTDSWLEGNPLCITHSTLFELCLDRIITLKEFREREGQINFRRWLPNILHTQWEELKSKVLNQHFNNGHDTISWGWTNSGAFSVKSVYEQLTITDSGESHSRIWRAKIPYKIKIFLWLLERNATLTKDNMVKRKWTGDPSCRFCKEVESVDHLFFQCPIAHAVWGITAICLGANNTPNNIRQFWSWIALALPNGQSVHTFGLAAICWAIWKTRNNACFEGKLIKHPAEIICYACSFMNYWTGLYKTDFQAQITDGVKVLLAMACRILVSQPRASPTIPRILPAIEDEEEEGDEA